MALAIITAIISAVVGAFIGAYLQRRWTPDYSSELTTLQKQVASFQQRFEAIEQERAEWEHLPFTAWLQQAVSGAYIMPVKNDSEEEITIETVTLKRNDVELSKSYRLKATDNGKVAAHRETQIMWAPQPDPTVTLQMKEPHIRPGEPIEIDLVLGCRIRGRAGTFRCKRLVTVDFPNRQMTDFSPK